MSIFESESAMQEWLRKEMGKCEGLADLISNTDYLEEFEPKGLEETRILNSYRTCLSALYINEIIAEDTNISLDGAESLRPDFLMYAPESQGIIIVELKNISGPTRQAGTELSAYAAEVKSYIPFLSDGDLFNVIISTSWPTLLRHYVFHEMFWQQKNLICLEPFEVGGDIKLKIKKIEEVLEADTATKLSAHHITGYQLCLYDKELYTDAYNRQRLDKYLPQMRAALAVMATEGNRQNGHGFGFLWKDHWEISLAPYSISIFNFAPFQSIERFLQNIEDLSELKSIQKRFIKLVQQQEPSGHGDSLWRITSAGIKFLDKICDPTVEGYLPWDVLKGFMTDRGELLAFHGWGLFGDIFNERLIAEYHSGNIDVSVTCPSLGLKVVEDLIDENYNFIFLSHIDFEDTQEE